MRLNRQQIKTLSDEIVATLNRRGLVTLKVPHAEAAAVVEKAVTDDFMKEERLNDEVREILKGYEVEIEQGRMDYNTMFDLVKKKLVRERGIVL